VTENFDVFLSYNRLDRRVVDKLAEALRERNLKVFKDDWYLRPGDFWPTALENKLNASAAVTVAVSRNGLGGWQQREVAAALDRYTREEKAGRAPPPVIPVLLEEGSDRQAGLAFLLQHTWVEGWDPRAADLIAGAVGGKAPTELYDAAHPDPRSRICPYRGLGYFREEDAGFYFGREPDVDKLTDAVDRYPLVAVVGPSGSGKSSLARAGLVPRLRRPAGERVWQVATLVPGGDPFLALARALLTLREPERYLTWSKGEIDDECDRLRNHLARDGAAHLSHVIGQIREEEPGTTHLLLLVDQWEELYTYRPTEAAAAEAHAKDVRRFIGMLLEATRRGEPLRAVLTLRADYWGEVLNDKPLAARLPDAALVHLRALARAALEAVIRKPAEQTRLAVEADLVEALLNDAEDQPGDLPLLEFALRQLWTARTGDGGVLTRQTYEDMGRLAKAIVSRADAVYDTLEPQERDAVPGVFAALVQVGEARSDLRRRARLKELSAAGQIVARRLADERLLVTGREGASGDDLVEVAHEALLRHWPKLKKWIDRRRGALLTIRQLQADTRTWLEKEKKTSYQWSHERVREAAVALKQVDTEVVLSREEQEFLGPTDPDGMLEELEQPKTVHKRRLLIGERLDVLGDRRPGVGVDDGGTPRIDWRPVKGGAVTVSILSDPNNPYSPPEDQRPKKVQAFNIGRYPVTVAQYSAFVDAKDGWRDKNWWGSDRYGDPEGELYRDDDGHTFEFGRFGNHPAVYVSWFDAVAFCRWLSRRSGFEVRLPDEWEWQRAATGGQEENAFPWGPDWDPKAEPWRANTFESRLGQATAVGMYPAGVSPTGALDMAGTVWEWCLNKFETAKVEETRSSADDFDTRVVRGGSWLNAQDYARSANRFGYSPYYRVNFIGFRVVCSSPSSGR
jgi:formylglycine-generating enzyme required for sulfatase activity